VGGSVCRRGTCCGDVPSSAGVRWGHRVARSSTQPEYHPIPFCPSHTQVRDTSLLAPLFSSCFPQFEIQAGADRQAHAAVCHAVPSPSSAPQQDQDHGWASVPRAVLLGLRGLPSPFKSREGSVRVCWGFFLRNKKLSSLDYTFKITQFCCLFPTLMLLVYLRAKV